LVNGVAPVPAPQSSNQCLISVNGVVQKPDDTGASGFRLSGGNIVFSAAPTGGQSFFGVILAGADYIYAGSNFPDGTVSAPSITFAQDLDTGFYRSGAGEVKFTANGTNVVTLSANNLTAPSFIPTSSTVPSNGVYLPSSNNVAISTNGQGRLFVNSIGQVGVGKVATQLVDVETSGNAQVRVTTTDTSGGTIGSFVARYTGGGGGTASTGVLRAGDGYTSVGASTNSPLVFINNETERMRLDTSGRLLVGTSTARTNFNTGAEQSHIQLEGTTFNTSNLSIVRNSANDGTAALTLGKSRSATVNGNTVVVSGDPLGFINFEGADGTNMVRGASITAQVDGTPGTNDMPGRLVFSTTADGASSPTERMRISNNGDILFNTTTTNTFFSGGRVLAAGDAQFTRNGATALTLRRMTSDGTIATFIPDNGNIVGTISVTSSATAYNTSSDYRLKENVVALTGAIDRINQLQVHRFNFIADPEKTVDGFIAHEAQAVVPECVTGAKDKVDADGNPVYQGIDQSKLVPLLTAALQEALAEIESLKARVSALEP
jgi:hypothetical protein